MPEEVARKSNMLRIRNPDDDSQFVDVKIIAEISFIDQHEYAQETRFTIQNGDDNSSRKTHVQHVTGSTDSSAKLDVEVIDQWGVIDQHAYAQETQFGMLGNKNFPEAHLKTHEFTIHNPDNSDYWVKVQRIDQIKFIDQHAYAQETIYGLKWKDDDDEPEGDVIDGGDGINPPYRLDPYQNIIDVHWTGTGGGHAHVGVIMASAGVEWTGFGSGGTVGVGGVDSGPGQPTFSETVVILPDGTLSPSGFLDMEETHIARVGDTCGGPTPGSNFTPTYSVGQNYVEAGLDDSSGVRIPPQRFTFPDTFTTFDGTRTYNLVYVAVGPVEGAGAGHLFMSCSALYDFFA